MRNELVRLADDIAYFAHRLSEAEDKTDIEINLSHLKRRLLDLQTEIAEIENQTKTKKDKENNNG